VFHVVGDAFHVAFHAAGDALRAALESQHDLNAEKWGKAPLKTRMGLHTGKAEIQANGDYQGYLTLSRVQRVMSLAFGGQILLSNACAELVRGELPEGASLLDLKEHRLKGLADPERLWQVVAPDLPRDFPSLPPLDNIPNNLPVQLTSFVGREKEVMELKRALNESHLLTLTGSGGTGKTRLSLKVAAEVLDTFPGGVWLLEFAPVSDPTLVLYILASLLGLRETAETKETLIELVCSHFQSRKALLIFDNCEHLIDACAQLADILLRSCKDLRILASSREALGIAGEAVYPVSPLPCPTDALSADVISDESGVQALHQFDAVRLFIDRVRAVQPAFAVSGANACPAYICQRLEDSLALNWRLTGQGMTVEQTFGGWMTAFAPDEWQPDRGAPPSNAAGDDGMELHPFGRARAHPVSAALRLRGRLDPGSGRGRQRRGEAQVARCARSHDAVSGQVARRRRGAKRYFAVSFS
jgi:hypothetical protein